MFHAFVPPHVSWELDDRIAPSKDESAKSSDHDDEIRGKRTALLMEDEGESTSVRIWDSEGTQKKRVVAADESSPEIKKVRQFSEFTQEWIRRVLGRDSIDGKGSTIHVNVHYGKDYMNAFWDGTDLVLGDGDEKVFKSFTSSIDVMAHEMAHGVVHHTSKLKYRYFSGALNEHYSDVLGTAVQQSFNDRTKDWLIGNEISGPTIYGEALRSMNYPGKAYDNEALGVDPQPGHWNDRYRGSGDNGGVHINSGIMNRMFYLAAVEIGTDEAAYLWHRALLLMEPNTDFHEAVKLIIGEARDMASKGEAPAQSAQLIRWAAAEVGIR